MTEEINVFKCLDFLRDESVHYAQAKANRVHIEEFRKSKKALLMREAESSDPQRYKSSASQETYAYAHPEYVELLDGLKDAVEQEERYRWLLEGARLKIEAWRTLESSKRVEARVL